MRRLAAALAALLTASACAAPSPPPALTAPAPVRLSSEQVDALATLLRLEDRREFDADALLGLSRDSSALVRGRTALTLGRLRDPSGLPPLLRLAQDPDSSVAATAAFALGQLGDSAAVPQLARLLDPALASASPSVASEAAYALGKIRAPRARAALRRFLAAAAVEDPSLRAPVASALLAVWRFPRDGTPDPIARWLDSPEPAVRWRATYALVRRPDPAAAPALLTLLQDPDTLVRALAARGLTRPLVDSAAVDRHAVVAALAAALRDPDYSTRINAARSLGSFPQVAAVEPLVAAVEADDRHLALVAAESLGRIGEQAAAASPALVRLARDRSAPVALRQAALEAAAAVAAEAARPVVDEAAADEHWRLRLSVARSAARADGAPAALDAFRGDTDARVRAAALQAALEAAGDSLAPLRAPLLEALGAEDVMIRAAALGGLQRLADPNTLPALLDAYARAQRDSATDAALAAIDAIAGLRGPGLQPERAFFARFRRPEDPLLRLRARERFGDAADRAWGDPLPVQTQGSPADYRALVERWIAPVVAGGEAPIAELRTESGTIRLRLFPGDAPLTVESFVGLAERGYFDGQEWPRVVPGFVVQGGDPRGDTSGGPGYTIRDEIGRRRYMAGTLGMALSGPDTGGSQFFVTHSPQPHLDGIYTVFGEVVEGLPVTHDVLPGERILGVRILR